jgi:hypothetical protein
MNMKIDFETFPIIGEDFNIVTIDLMQYTDGHFTPMINYTFTNDADEKVLGGMSLITGMSFSSITSASNFFSLLVKNGFFIQPVSNVGYIFSETGDLITSFKWNEQFSDIILSKSNTLH